MTASRTQNILRNIRAMSDGAAILTGGAWSWVLGLDTGATASELAQLVRAGDVEQRGAYYRVAVVS